MIKFIISLFLITNFVSSQNTKSERLLDNIYEKIITKNGVSIEFNYWFENGSYKMENPISGTIALFSNNKFYLEFNSENKMIQIYNGHNLSTILIEEKEIQIDNLNHDSDLFIQNIFTNYRNKFDSNIKDETSNTIIIVLTPKAKNDSSIFNNCIDELKLPACLKLPVQCRIGLDSIRQNKLYKCLEKNKNQIPENISSIELELNSHNHSIKSITQKNRYNGITKIIIKKITEKNEKCLILEDNMYQDFERIDLR